jgi:hypothetical protein
VSWQQSAPSSAAPHYVLGVFCFLLAIWAAMHKPFPTPRLTFGNVVSILFVFSSAVVMSISLLCQVIIHDGARVWRPRRFFGISLLVQT